MSCECIASLNAELANHNCRIAQAIRLTDGMAKLMASTIVATEKLDKSKRKAPPPVVATFCPFCGVEENP